MYQKSFVFKTTGAQVKKSTVFVNPGELYNHTNGYGYITDENRIQDELLRIPELCSGFEPSGIQINRPIPTCFKIDVGRQGNYRVSVEISNPDGKEVLLFLGRRRLYLKETFTGTKTFTYSVNICDIIPRGKERIYSDTTLDVALIGKNAEICRIDVKETSCPTIYIAGDSTVTDQSAEYPYSPGTSYCGWGQMITAYLNEDVALSNHAHSGLTTESFRKEGHYSVVAQYIKPGDYFLIQFGHNDQKLDHLKYNTGYRENIVRYIREIRSQGANPIIVTPLSRNTWKGNDGSYNDLLEKYDIECIRIGEELKVPVVNLHKASMEFIKKHGLEGSKPYYFPGDYTHNNDYGAYLMAGFVAKELLRIASQSVKEAYKVLNTFIRKDTKEWVVDPKLLIVPKKSNATDVHVPEESAFDNIPRPESNINRVESLEMIIQAEKFFPINVYNDMYDDVVGHEWYAGTVECAYQNGIIPSSFVENRCFCPTKEVNLEEFLILLMNGYLSRKKLPTTSPCVYDKEVEPYAVTYIRAALALGVINENEDLCRKVKRKEAAMFCKAIRV